MLLLLQYTQLCPSTAQMPETLCRQHDRARFTLRQARPDIYTLVPEGVVFCVALWNYSEKYVLKKQFEHDTSLYIVKLEPQGTHVVCTRLLCCAGVKICCQQPAVARVIVQWCNAFNLVAPLFISFVFLDMNAGSVNNGRQF